MGKISVFLVCKKIRGVLIFVAMTAWSLLSMLGIIIVVYKFLSIKGYHEIHKNLYTTKFNLRTVLAKSLN